MSTKKSRIVKGICDTYIATEQIDPVSGKPFLEITEAVVSDGETFSGDWLCDIDGSLSDSDEYILNEIDSAMA